MQVCAVGDGVRDTGLSDPEVLTYRWDPASRVLTLTADDLGDGISIVQLIVKSGLAKSGKDAKRLIKENGAKLDDAPLTNAGLMIDAAALSSPIKLSAGKKRHALVQLDG